MIWPTAAPTPEASEPNGVTETIGTYSYSHRKAVERQEGVLVG